MKEHEDNEEIVKEGEENPIPGEEVEFIEEENGVDSKVTKIKGKLEQCRTQKQEYLDGWQRAKADYVNAVRRFKEENQNAATAGIVRAVEAFLPALDSLERAKETEELPPGFEAIIKQIEGAFTALNVSEVEAQVGTDFDLTRHEALGRDKTTTPEQDDKISAVLERGWQVNDLVIRPAKVRVAYYE